MFIFGKMNGLFIVVVVVIVCKLDGMILDLEVWFGDLDGVVDWIIVICVFEILWGRFMVV